MGQHKDISDTASVTEDNIFNNYVHQLHKNAFFLMCCFLGLTYAKNIETVQYSEMTTISKCLLVPSIYNTKSLKHYDTVSVTENDIFNVLICWSNKH